MANFYLSPVGSIFQYLTDAGVVLSGGKVNTYLAGSSTPQATYTDSTGGTPNANPIILASNGRYNNVGVWQPQGVKIKVIVTDSNNNQLGPTMDNLVGIGDNTFVNNSYYGGVDTGSANSYKITAGTLTTIQDGTFIVWIPGIGNTNTGASTIQINSLAAINLLSSLGTATTANQIIAGTPVLTVIYAGSAYIFSGASVGTYTATITGVSSGGTGTVTYVVSSQGTVNLTAAANILGNSNSTSATMTGMPAAIRPAREQFVGGWGMVSSGVVQFGMFDILTSGTINLNVPTVTAGSPGVVGYNTTGFVNDAASKGVAAHWSINYSLL